MNNDRYIKMIQYKAALDDLYKKRNPLSMYADEYDKTLSNAKLAGFKVLRNSKGEHKLINNVKSDNEANMLDLFADILRGEGK